MGCDTSCNSRTLGSQELIQQTCLFGLSAQPPELELFTLTEQLSSAQLKVEIAELRLGPAWVQILAPLIIVE